jgi:hypothetical protein
VMQRPAAAGIRAIIAAAFQRAVCAHIAARTHRALLYCQGRHELSGLVLSGGVACNSALRTQLETLSAQYGVQTHAPDPALCVDNGVMIAWNGIEKLRNGEVGSVLITWGLWLLLFGVPLGVPPAFTARAFNFAAIAAAATPTTILSRPPITPLPFKSQYQQPCTKVAQFYSHLRITMWCVRCGWVGGWGDTGGSVWIRSG